jgi:hypothetical protein
MKRTTLNGLVSALIVGSSLLAAAGPTQAALITGKLDPLFGGSSALSSLDVTGNEYFFVADACLGHNGTVQASGTCGVSPAGMLFNSATFTFTDPNSLWSQDVTFSPVFLTGAVTDMVIKGGQVVGIDTSEFEFATLNYGGKTYDLGIQLAFSVGAGQTTMLSILNCGSSSDDDVDDKNGQLTCSNQPGGSSSALATSLTTSAIPEPGSLLLACSAVVAGAVVRRRSRNRT